MLGHGQFRLPADMLLPILVIHFHAITAALAPHGGSELKYTMAEKEALPENPPGFCGLGTDFKPSVRINCKWKIGHTPQLGNGCSVHSDHDRVTEQLRNAVRSSCVQIRSNNLTVQCTPYSVLHSVSLPFTRLPHMYSVCMSFWFPHVLKAPHSQISYPNSAAWPKYQCPKNTDECGLYTPICTTKYFVDLFCVCPHVTNPQNA